MEDAAIHNPNIGDGNGLFAVFDGHGGTLAITQDFRLVGTLQIYSPRS